MTRKMQGVLTALAVAACGASVTHAQVTHAGEPVTGVWRFHHEHVLGTSLEIGVRAGTEVEAARAEAAILGSFDRHEAILSAWRSDSEFSRWARTRFEPVPVSDELYNTLAAFDTWRERTNGALDPSVEAATKLWKHSTAEGRVPTDREIAEVREAMAQPHWKLEPEARTATRVSDVPLALASFAKSRIAAAAADAAIANGASGVMLNIGGDVLVRGAMTQVVGIADVSGTDNGRPLDHVVVADRAVATSGGYRRGFSFADQAASPVFSHLIDPRTAHPVAHMASSTVIARDAETAGALATAFSVLPAAESEKLAAQMPGVAYLLIGADGQCTENAEWARYALAPAAKPVAFLPQKATTGLYDSSYELSIDLTLPRINDARYRRPFVAVWIEDADHFPVRTVALWFDKSRWLPELKQWYRDDQVRNLAEGSDITTTVSSATRPPGRYTLKWDGKDNQGKLVKAGKYTVVIEASREHGGYQVERHEFSFTGKPEQALLPAGDELGEVSLAYKKR